MNRKDSGKRVLPARAPASGKVADGGRERRPSQARNEGAGAPGWRAPTRPRSEPAQPGQLPGKTTQRHHGEAAEAQRQLQDPLD